MWTGCIIGPMGTTFDNRFYGFEIVCGPAYPKVAPTIKFNNKINLPFVKQNNGQVDPTKLPLLKNWQEKTRMQDILQTLKQSMVQNGKLPQNFGEGEEYKNC